MVMIESCQALGCSHMVYFDPPGCLRKMRHQICLTQKQALGKYHYEVRQKGEKHTSQTWKLAQQKKTRPHSNVGSGKHRFPANYTPCPISTHSSIATFLFEDFRGKNLRGSQKKPRAETTFPLQFGRRVQFW